MSSQARRMTGLHVLLLCQRMLAAVVLAAFVGSAGAEGSVQPASSGFTEWSYGNENGPYPPAGWYASRGAACESFRRSMIRPQPQTCGPFSILYTVYACYQYQNAGVPPPAPGWRSAGRVQLREYLRGKVFSSGVGCVDPPPPGYFDESAYLYFRGAGPAACPPNASVLTGGGCECRNGYRPSDNGKECLPKDNVPGIEGGNACHRAPKKNPVYPLEGSKSERLRLTTFGGIPVELVYDTRPMTPLRQELASAGVGERSITQVKAFGPLWSSTFHRYLRMDPSARAAAAVRGDGRVVGFTGDGTGGFVSTQDSLDELIFSGVGLRYYDGSANAVETYQSGEGVTKRATVGGSQLQFTYSAETTVGPEAPEAGLLTTVSDAFGRTLQYRYENVSGNVRVKKLIEPGGREFLFGYDASNNLTTVSWPDGTSRTFRYDNAGLPWALTGIVDETDTQYATFGYDAQGRAISSEHAGGVDKVEVVFGSAPTLDFVDEYATNQDTFYRRWRWAGPTSATLTLPNNVTSSMTGVLAGGSQKLESSDQPAGSGCAGSSVALTYDAAGSIASRNDLDGNRTCYSNHQARNVELVRVEGLAATAQCSLVTTGGAAVPAGGRKISTEWHPDWRLKTRQAEPGRRTTYVYQGQDPLGTGSAANCGVAGMTLPDGKPPALLCKQVEQATTDADGGLAFGAPLQDGVADRVRSWTYNAFGQVRTETDPLNRVTLYEYYDNTAFTGSGPDAEGYTKGDLKQVTNAAGHAVQYTKYNPAGQVLEMKDANNVVTRFAYDTRQRLISTTIGARTTTRTYWPNGLLRQVTQPDGSYVTYEYDPAQRMKAVSDNLDNRIEYELDAAGNRQVERVKDPIGALRRQVDRVFDALDRVEKTTGRD